MSDDMIERASRAYDPEIWFNIDMYAGRNDPEGAPWKLTRKHCLDRARAAIEAMREPTAAMCRDGYDAACEHDNGNTVPSHEIAPATYRAMIDRALK